MDAIWVILLGVLGFLVGFFAGFSICTIVMVVPLKKEREKEGAKKHLDNEHLSL